VRALYSLLGYLIAPVYFVALLVRGLRERGYWHGFPARLGFGPALAPGTLWVHAASAGEVQAAAPLVQALRRRAPLRSILVTTATPAGAARARRLLEAERVEVRHAPVDLPGAVRRFLARVQPQLAVFIETELWPNLYHACARRGVPLVIASARLSERSARRYARCGSLFRQPLATAWIAAQSEQDAERFRALGATPARVQVLGNLKFDFRVREDGLARGRALRLEHAPQRPLWVAGSTHAGEEEVLLAAHRRLRESEPGALLVLAPRHAPRFAQVGAALEAAGWRSIRRSSAAGCPPEAAVLLLDTLGELLDFYAAGDVAFVGGTLVPVGGHNLLEPAALGRPVLAGPHVFNAPEVAARLAAGGGLEFVRDADELGARLAAWLASAPLREQRGASARAVLEANRGALERLLALIEPLLDAAGSSELTAAGVPGVSAP
jgi:3-deoxy-D-manno-octulosonic-acid transferase